MIDLFALYGDRYVVLDLPALPPHLRVAYIPADHARIVARGDRLGAVVQRGSMVAKKLRRLPGVILRETIADVRVFEFQPAAFPAVAAILLPERLPAPEQPEPNVPYGRTLAEAWR